MDRTYYAGYSYMGVEYTYDSPCWTVYAFTTAARRNAWVCANEYNDQGNRVAEVITRRQAVRIAGRECIDNIRDDQYLRRHGYSPDAIWSSYWTDPYRK